MIQNALKTAQKDQVHAPIPLITAPEFWATEIWQKLRNWQFNSIQKPDQQLP